MGDLLAIWKNPEKFAAKHVRRGLFQFFEKQNKGQFVQKCEFYENMNLKGLTNLAITCWL